MTIYSRKTAEGLRWRYDFERGGARYNSPATYSTQAKAARAERAHKAAIDKGATGPTAPRKAAAAKREARSVVTVADACELYWRDTAQHLRSAADVRQRLAIVRRLLGDTTPLANVGFSQLNEAVQARRREPSRYGRELSGAAVNRDIVDTFRPARKRAALVYGLALPEIAWGELRLKERGEIVREFDFAEIDRWARELSDDAERLYLALALTYGARRGELYFPADALAMDAPGGPELELGRYLNRAGEWRESRKDGSRHTVTLDPADAEAIAAQAARAASAGCEHIWVDSKGRAISYYAMGHRLRAAAARAGVEPGRILHGMRHHAATAILRANGGGNLALAQRLLGHKKITTTQRYAHVHKDDLRAALGRVSARSGGRGM